IFQQTSGNLVAPTPGCDPPTGVRGAPCHGHFPCLTDRETSSALLSKMGRFDRNDSQRRPPASGETSVPKDCRGGPVISRNRIAPQIRIPPHQRLRRLYPRCPATLVRSPRLSRVRPLFHEYRFRLLLCRSL